MSIQGKKIAMVNHALSVAQAIFENLRTNLNNPFKLETGLIHIRLQAEADRCALQSTPADRFNDDGTLKPLDITTKSVVMVTGGVTREEMENGLRKIGEFL